MFDGSAVRIALADEHFANKQVEVIDMTGRV